MKGSSSATRSYLHQLAEPVPQPAALLTPRRPTERGATHSALDAIPPILDSISDPLAEAPAPHHQMAAGGTRARRAQTLRSRALSVDAATQPHFGTGADNSSLTASGTWTAARRASTTLAADEVLQRPDNTTRDTLSSRETHALQDNAALQSGDSKQFFAHASSATARMAAKASALDDPNHIARDQSRRGIRVHIGTVEVRTAAPVREPKPAPAIDRSTRTDRSGVAAEPLSRGLAWSHGLVQG
jgi:hypothetical protein